MTQKPLKLSEIKARIEALGGRWQTYNSTVEQYYFELGDFVFERIVPDDEYQLRKITVVIRGLESEQCYQIPKDQIRDGETYQFRIDEDGNMAFYLREVE